MDAALEKFFAAPRAMTGSLRQSSAESIEAMHNILWGTWHPGHDEVSLRYNDTLDRVEMRIVNVRHGTWGNAFFCWGRGGGEVYGLVKRTCRE